MKNLIVTTSALSTIRGAVRDGLNISSGARSSATYYHSAKDQVEAIKGAVNKLYNVSKELPLLLANLDGSTGRFIQEVLLNEFLKTTLRGACNIINPLDWVDDGLNDKAILGALYRLEKDHGVPYVFRLFVELRKGKVNNSRMAKIVLGYIWNHSNIEFISVKYRSKIKTALTHVYGEKKNSILQTIAKRYIENNIYDTTKSNNIAQEMLIKYTTMTSERAFALFLFIMKDGKPEYYDETNFPIISQYYKATSNIEGLTIIPEEVLVGLLSDKNHPQYDEMWSNKEKREATQKLIRETTRATSVDQRIRQTKSNKKLGVSVSVDLMDATDFMSLYKTGYENEFTIDLMEAIENLAEKQKLKSFPYSNIGVIVDTSNSMDGHLVESKNTPKIIADFTKRVLVVSSKNTVSVETRGQTTELAEAFVELMKQEVSDKPYEAIFILSDGYENSYDGLTSEVINIYKAEVNREIAIFHLSPITSAEMGAKVRPIGDNISTIAITKPAGLMSQLTSNLLEADTRQWLKNEFRTLNRLEYKRLPVPLSVSRPSF